MLLGRGRREGPKSAASVWLNILGQIGGRTLDVLKKFCWFFQENFLVEKHTSNCRNNRRGTLGVLKIVIFQNFWYGKVVITNFCCKFFLVMPKNLSERDSLVFSNFANFSALVALFGSRQWAFLITIFFWSTLNQSSLSSNTRWKRTSHCNNRALSPNLKALSKIVLD